LSDTKNRIKSMAMVHRMIYEANDLSRLDLGVYVRELVNVLVRSFERNPGKIAIEEDLESFPVLIDIAIPCGLILTELVTNALKYAFPGGEGGRITLSLHRAKGGAIELGIADSGPGFVAGFDPRRDGHLGLQTVLALAEDQLGGKVEISGDDGVRWLISFEDSAFKARV
jgi:two-component sensor histidine kinase